MSKYTPTKHILVVAAIVVTLLVLLETTFSDNSFLLPDEQIVYVAEEPCVELTDNGTPIPCEVQQ